MTVLPIQRSAGLRWPWLLDVTLGLLVVAALPLAVVTIPNTLSVVAKLLPGDADQVGLMRTHGLALPALMLTVPLAAAALRRVSVVHVLLGGLVLVALSDVAGGYAGSEFVVGVVRVLRGVGAGLIIPATLTAVWSRSPVLRALWVGVFSLSLLAAQALALWPLDQAHSWKITLQPYPLLTGIALALAGAYVIVWLLLGVHAAPGLDDGERNRLLLAAVPAAGIAVVGVATATEGWRAIPVIALAVVALVALLALASIGTVESRALAYTMVAVGVVLLPSAAQMTMVEMGGLGGPGLNGLWAPYGVAAVLAVGASVTVRRLGRPSARWRAPLGLLAMVAGLCSVRLLVPSADGLVLVVPFSLMAVGAAVALTSALEEVGIGAAVFGLSLGLAGVLAGFLLGTGVQMAVLDGVSSVQELVDSFVGALHAWALVGGFFVVMMIALTALMARKAAKAVAHVPCAGPMAAAGEIDDDVPAGDGPIAFGTESAFGAESSAADASGARQWGDGKAVRPPGMPPEGNAEAGRSPRGDGEAGRSPRDEAEDGGLPAVPPQGHSPEDPGPS